MTPPPPSASGGSLFDSLDLAFFQRVYRTSLILVLLGSLLIWERFRAPSALGWLMGAGVSLLMLAGLEWSVRQFVRPEQQSMNHLLGVTAIKMVVVGALLLGAFLGALRGWISLVWMLGGFALPHAVIVLKLIGQKLNASSPAPPTPRR